MDDNVAKVKIDDLSFQELMLDVKKGNIRIPNFQREFVWEQSQIISLLDSIYHHYPIGSFLFWRTKEKIESFRTIGDVKLDQENSRLIHYVLDGQQRITSLFACLEEAEIKVKIKGRTVKKKLEIFFNLDEEEFVADPYAKTKKKKYYKPKRLLSFPNQIDYISFLKVLVKKFEEFECSKERVCQWLTETLKKNLTYANQLFNDCITWKLFEWKSDHYCYGKNKDTIYENSLVGLLIILATHFAWFEDIFDQLKLTPKIDNIEEFRKIVDERTEEELNDPWYLKERLKWLQGLKLGIYNNDKFTLTNLGIQTINKYHEFRNEEKLRQEQLEQDYQQRYISLKQITGQSALQLVKNLPDARFDVVNRVVSSFNSYPFSIIYVIEQPVDVACDIFERINNSGQILKLVDLMVAKSYSPTFNMRERMYQFFQELEKENYNDIPDVTILQCLAAILGKSIKRRDILLLDKNKISKSWDNIIESIRKAIDYLKAEFNLTSSKILPYNNLLVPLSYYFYNNKNEFISDKAKNELQLWFWKASFTSRYDSAVETKIGDDLLEIDKIIKEKKPNFDYQIPLIDEERIINQKLYLGSAFCKSILCLYNQMNPVEFLNNTPVKLSTFSKFNSAELHHIFPQAYMKKYLPDQTEMTDSIVNIAIASSALNKKYRDKPPKEYFNNCKKKNTNFVSAMESHLIYDFNSSGISENDYGKFLNHRAEKIINEIQARIGKLSRIEIEIQKDEKGVIDDFEYNIRKIIDSTLKPINLDYWNRLHPEFIERVELRIKNWLKTNPSRKREDANPLDFCQIYDYFKIIKTYWKEFEIIFISKSEIEKHFHNITEFRNAMMHSREIDLSIRKLAEGSLIWFNQIFEKIEQ